MDQSGMGRKRVPIAIAERARYADNKAFEDDVTAWIRHALQSGQRNIFLLYV
jgi:hypothetical protein